MCSYELKEGPQVYNVPLPATATAHLAEAAVDALGHVDVVAGGAAAAILTLLCLNSDGLDDETTQAEWQDE
jgi:hypothetical protein